MNTIFSLLFILIVSLTLFGQTEKKNDAGKKVKPDFSGTWMLDRNETERLKSIDKRVHFDATLVIIHREPEINITRSVIYQGKAKTVKLIFNTDGESVKNFTEQSDVVTEEHKWDGSVFTRKIIAGEKRRNFEREVLQRTITERWKLSKDGKKLTVLRTEEYPHEIYMGPKNSQYLRASYDIKFVYNLISKDGK